MFFKRHRNLLLAVLLASLCIAFASAYTGLAVRFFSCPVLPHHSDESAYFMDSRSFVINHSLVEPLLLEESTSPVGHFGTHGFAYTILDGAAQFLSGQNTQAKIYCNLALLFTAILICCRLRKTTPVAKLALVIGLVSLYAVTVWLFTYMQEIVNIFLAVLIGWMLCRLEDDYAPKTPLLAYFCLVVFFCVTFRFSWLFAIFGLLPYIKRRTTNVVTIGGIGLCFAWGLAQILLFSAGNKFGSISVLLSLATHGEYVQAISFFAQLCCGNIWSFFFEPATVSFITLGKGLTFFSFRLAFVALVIYVIVLACKGSRLALSAAIVAGLHLLFLFLLYDCYDWHELRGMAPCFVILIMALARLHKVWPLAIFSLYFACCLPATTSMSRELIRQRQRLYVSMQEHENKVEQISEIATLPMTGDLAYVIASYSFLSDGGFLPLLPLRAANGTQIIYSFNASSRPLYRVQPQYLMSEKDEKSPCLVPKLTNAMEHVFEVTCRPRVTVEYPYGWYGPFASGNDVLYFSYGKAGMTLTNSSNQTQDVDLGFDLAAPAPRSVTITVNGKDPVQKSLVPAKERMHLKVLVGAHATCKLTFESSTPASKYPWRLAPVIAVISGVEVKELDSPH